VNRLLASLLLAAFALVAVAPPAYVPEASASVLGIPIPSFSLWVVVEGDPDTPDLRGTKYTVYDREGNPVEVDQAWLSQTLITTFGNWLELIK